LTKRWPDKYLVGLTGNIATGKSAVLKMAAEREALILDADQIVHNILDGDHFVQEAVVALFGPEIQLPDGRIDRAAVAEIVFNDPDALVALERIMHPAVRRRLFEQIDLSPNQIVFIEAIKLLEGGLADECEEIWVTRCPQETQIERLVAFRAMDRDEAFTRVNAQSPQAEKVALADVVIDTAGTLDDTEAYFNLAWLGLRRRMRLAAQEPSRETRGPDANEQVSADPIPAGEPNPPQITEDKTTGASDYFEEDPAFAGITVRRAQLSDGAQVAQLISKATNGVVEMTRSEMLSALGERGYLIAQQGDETNAVAGWSTENLVATIDQIFLYPLESARKFGGALLNEIERTAKELICEVILAFPRGKDPDEIHHLLIDWGYTYVDSSSLPHNWQVAVSELGSEESLVMVKILRDTRQTSIRYLNQIQALRSP
jgi:dephospho-CoA kinase